ncbi:MAG TPA: DUF6789 family protein [Anaerolineales bacterium]|nr:DUF6789 family protein [Anaerolineales bacterium]
MHIRGVICPSSSDLSFLKLLQGAAAGFIATAPMSISMLVGWKLLPEREKYPLPPRLITEDIVERVGIEDRLSEGELVGLTIFSHFGYGALFGSIYTLFVEKLPVPSILKGGFAGLALWVGSYLGWLPAMGILRSAIRHPWRRNLLMIIAHLIWGVTVGEVTRKLTANNQR